LFVVLLLLLDMSKKKVCIVGAGTAGMSAAWSLSRYPDRFDVTVCEKNAQAGGVATTENIEIMPGVFCDINDGVQGGSSSYRNSILLHRQVGYEPSPVNMHVSFGQHTRAWTNYLPSDSNGTDIQQLESEIARFGRYLKLISWLEPIFIFIPIWLTARLFCLSTRFTNAMLYPLTALFFGTGNQTAHVSSALIARVFLDPDLKLFDYNSQRLLASQADMFAFGHLRDIYRSLADKCIELSGGQTKFYFNQTITRVSSTNVFVEQHRLFDTFDVIIFACDAETVLKIVQQPSARLRAVLGNVEYFDDVTYTHTDVEYMNAHYTVHIDSDQYFIYTDVNEPQRPLEMSFNLSNYQPQLIALKRDRYPRLNIFQTIYLNKLQSNLWTVEQLNKKKIVLERWWRQFAHVWQHFLFTVPLMRFVQNEHRQRLFAGAYTMFNTHEIACISGLAAAHRLGATYPFEYDSLAVKQFDLYMNYVYGQSRTGRSTWIQTIITWTLMPLLWLAISIRKHR
jgi:predicted NAD/FAD-binding protein